MKQRAFIKGREVYLTPEVRHDGARIVQQGYSQVLMPDAVPRLRGFHKFKLKHLRKKDFSLLSRHKQATTMIVRTSNIVFKSMTYNQ